MCCGGKKKDPYAQQRYYDTERIQNDYNTQAASWNTAADAYNRSLGDLSGTYNSLQSRLGGLNIADLNGLNSFRNDLNNFTTTFGGLQLSQQRPTLANTQNLYGQNVTFSVPTLANANTTLYDSIQKGLGGLTGSINDLFARRTQEEGRVKTFQDDIYSNLSGLGSTIQGLNIANDYGLNSARSSLAGLRTKINNFTSPLGVTWNFEPGNDIGALTGRVEDLFTQRGAELGRISNYEKGIFDLADSLQGGLQGLDIRNIDQINALDSQLEARRRDARRFSSLLPFDFSQELGALDEVDLSIEDLKAKRAAEENRIRAQEADFLQRADLLGQRAEGLDIYNLGAITGAQRDLANMRQQATRFSSLLPFDFTDELGGLTGAEGTLQGLLDRRNTALEGYRTRANDFTTNINALNLQDEAALRKAMADAGTVRGELSRFSGSDVEGVAGAFQTAIDRANSRLDELMARRADIETRAQALLKQATESSFYYKDDLSNPQSQLDAMKAEAELFKAQQAMDEIDAIMRRISSERQRLEADAQQVAARNAQAAAAVQGGGVLPPGMGTLTAQEYAAFLARNRTDDPLLAPTAGTSFARSLGLG